MGLHRMGPPEDLVLALQQRQQVRDFVETGTYRGDTAAWAAAHFPRVTTVELSPQYFAAASARFASQPQVRVLQGSSGEALRGILPALTGPTIFWLDAHWSGLDTAGRETECPLLDEVALINASATTHTLLVDDARLFSAPPPRPHRADKWPDLASTVDALRAGGRRYVVMFEDVLVAVPESERAFLTEWIQDDIAAKQAREPRGWWKKLRG